MECSICKQQMTMISQDVSYNRPDAENTEYDRTTYHCIHDDVWVITEVPKN